MTSSTMMMTSRMAKTLARKEKELCIGAGDEDAE
jgi:hypothetical protein